jgi:hypothetical protein
MEPAQMLLGGITVLAAAVSTLYLHQRAEMRKTNGIVHQILQAHLRYVNAKTSRLSVYPPPPLPPDEEDDGDRPTPIEEIADQDRRIAAARETRARARARAREEVTPVAIPVRERQLSRPEGAYSEQFPPRKPRQK